MVGTLGMLVAGSLVFGSAQAATAATCSPAPTNSYPGTVVLATSFEAGGFCGLVPKVSGTGKLEQFFFVVAGDDVHVAAPHRDTCG